MAAIEDHAYLKICADLAKCLSISLAAARRKVEIEAARNEIRDSSGRKKIAQLLLGKALASSKNEKESSAVQLDELLTALAEDENFMVED